MAKGGRYLNTNKKEKKKSKGLKILLIVVLILALLLGGGYFAVRTFIGSMLGNVNRAEVVEQNSDKSYEDLIAELNGGMDLGAEEEGEEEDFFIPESEASEQTTVPVTGNTEEAG